MDNFSSRTRAHEQSDEDLRRTSRSLERRIDENIDLLSSEDDNFILLKDTENILDEISSIYRILSSKNSHLTHNHNEKLRRWRHILNEKKERYIENKHRDELYNSFEGDGQGNAELTVNMNLLLGDKSSLNNSNRGVNSMLEEGYEVRDMITRGRIALENMTGNIGTTNMRFGSIDEVMTSIRRSKTKQTIIISLVVAGCTCFLLWYWLRS